MKFETGMFISGLGIGIACVAYTIFLMTWNYIPAALCFVFALASMFVMVKTRIR